MELGTFERGFDSGGLSGIADTAGCCDCPSTGLDIFSKHINSRVYCVLEKHMLSSAMNPLNSNSECRNVKMQESWRLSSLRSSYGGVGLPKDSPEPMLSPTEQFSSGALLVLFEGN
nr:hypothetical protein Iba_chr08dCG5030 [Ipomoea batatas]